MRQFSIISPAPSPIGLGVRDRPKMSDVITKLGGWGSTEPCVQRMTSEISRPLKAGCSCSQNTTIVLKVVATDLIKTDKIKSVSQEVLHTIYCIPQRRRLLAGLSVWAAAIRAREIHMEGAGNCAFLSYWTS